MPLSDRLSKFISPSLQSMAQAGFLGISSRLKLGTNVFSQDWDLLIILDTCRVDALEEVAPEYDFLPDSVSSVWSVGSSTMEWVGNTFVGSYREEINKTAVVSENPQMYYGLRDNEFPIHSSPVKALASWGMVEETTLLHYDPVWQYALSDPWTGLPLPSCTTDRAIATGRTKRPDRCLVHYLPPHEPYRATALAQNRPLREAEKEPWRAIQNGVPKSRIWRLYLDELRWALDEVSTLLANYDAQSVIITADHGELFGEWGLYSHSGGVPHWNLRKVPWVETTATDTGEYEPTLVPSSEQSTVNDRAKRQLEQLGYV